MLPEKESKQLEKTAGDCQLFVNEKLLIRDRERSNVLRVILRIQHVKVESF